MNIPFTKTKKGILLKIKVEPRSSKKGITGIIGDSLKVRVNAPPVGGSANEELVEVLAEKFSIKKSSIKIIRGQTSKDKIVEIEGKDSIP
jgi:hypothetical protein